MPKLLWSYGLSEFLRHSNEDAVCSRFIGKLTAAAVRRLWPDCTRAIRIADVGCGQASKAAQIATYLHHRGIRTDWELIDIDERWKPAITESLKAVRQSNELRFDVQCPVAAESWLQARRDPPDVAQFIHVPYDDDSEEMVYNIARDLAARRSLILIAAEHPESDLSLIRRRMSQLGYTNLPSERTTSLARRLKDAGLVVKRYVIGKKYLDLGEIDQIGDVDWFWDVIVGNKSDIKDKAALLDVVKSVASTGYIPSLGATLLNAPDFLITVRQRV